MGSNTTAIFCTPYNSSRAVMVVTLPTRTLYESPFSCAFHALWTAYTTALTDAFVGSCAVAKVNIVSGCVAKNSASRMLRSTTPNMVHVPSARSVLVVVNGAPVKAVLLNPRTPLRSTTDMYSRWEDILAQESVFCTYISLNGAFL